MACPLKLTNLPSATVWGQLVRAADSVSNNLVEAEDASSTADFLYKIELTLREAKESRICLAKLRLAKLDAFEQLALLEDEAGQLCAIFATIATAVLYDGSKSLSSTRSGISRSPLTEGHRRLARLAAF